ncbi:hypothetical protein PanWU01x14_308840 [Parasponia andersonii]|uniref:Uncharacterized protein n=1 Tax=Parasponia andersonii TaxID=3476 RepID=A0A2P5AQT2_PARAD|nr:hypothetical protein PanWU01x14_308840 [Parasponia andersonii]
MSVVLRHFRISRDDKLDPVEEDLFEAIVSILIEENGGLRRLSTEIPPSEVKGDRSKSVLFDACGLDKAMQSLETEHNWNREKNWELISHV